MITYQATDALIARYVELHNTTYKFKNKIDADSPLVICAMRDRYLGNDTDSQKIEKEFAALPRQEVQVLCDKRDLGEYNPLLHLFKYETVTALRVLTAIAARDTLEDYVVAENGILLGNEELRKALLEDVNVEPDLLIQFQDSSFVSKIVEVFPDGKITPQDFATVINPYNFD